MQSDDNTIGVPGSGPSNVIGDIGGGGGTAGILLSNVDPGDLEGADNNTIEDNFIGTDHLGTTARANTVGISAKTGAGANTIGGDGADQGNLISSNLVAVGATSETTIEGNWIGLASNGTSKLANTTGVQISGGTEGVIVGGDDASTDATDAGARNVIVSDGVGSAGVLISGDGAVGHTVEGNFIGTDATGLVGLDPGGPGVLIRNGAGDPAPAAANVIGGNSGVERNVIADGNPHSGVQIRQADTTNNLIQGNLIGTDRTGAALLTNGLGVFIGEDADGNTIGGQGAGEGNLIAGTSAVRLDDVDGTGIHGNLIGTDPAGTAALQGPGAGVYLLGGAKNNVIGSAAAPNTIAGRSALGDGVLIEGAGTTGNQVRGNRIGTDITGTAALGVTGDGVRIRSGASANSVGAGGGEGNVIAGVGGNGVAIESGPQNSVLGNRIGVGSNSVALPVGANGVLISGANDNDIGGTGAGEGNLISGAAGGFAGVLIDDGGTENNRVRQNLIGTGSDGTTPLAGSSQDRGVAITGGADNNQIGGTSAAAANLISGNDDEGVAIQDSDSNQVLGNLIGTNPAGTAAVPNGSHGVLVDDSSGGTTIGAADSSPSRGDGGAGNLISGNGTGGGAESGVELLTSSDPGGVTTVAGNYIGTTAGGTTALRNEGHGVRITAGPSLIGGASAGAGNLISGNLLNGVQVEAGSDPGQEIEGNTIGPHRDGESAIAGNPLQAVGVEAQGSGVAIGGEAAGAGNTIARNGIEGVQVRGPVGPTGVPILGNSIFDNGSGALDPGIDLNDLVNGLDGPTANDPGDADTGANGLQNYPLLTEAETNAATAVKGSLNSASNSEFRIEFFASPGGDPSGNGEGKAFLGSTDVSTNGSGDATIAVTDLASSAVGNAITATATEIGGGADNTSEFSTPVNATAAPDPPDPPEPVPAPALGLKLKKRLAVDKLKAKLVCDQGPCEVALKGKAVVKIKGKASAARKTSFRLKTKQLSLAAGEKQKAKLKLKRNRRSVRKITKLLRRGAKGKLKLRAIATNGSGKDVANDKAKLRPARR